jgi:tRNA-dihydrouridine synthase C
MQDVSVLPLWRCLERRGGPDVYVTEYFRVHRNSHPDREILRSITAFATGLSEQLNLFFTAFEHNFLGSV